MTTWLVVTITGSEEGLSPGDSFTAAGGEDSSTGASVVAMLGAAASADGSSSDAVVIVMASPPNPAAGGGLLCGGGVGSERPLMSSLMCGTICLASPNVIVHRPSTSR